MGYLRCNAAPTEDPPKLTNKQPGQAVSNRSGSEGRLIIPCRLTPNRANSGSRELIKHVFAEPPYWLAGIAPGGS